MPPPITSIRFGTARSSSAPVESTMRGSSGMNGSFTACEPAAMMAFANRTTVFSPVGAWPGPDVSCTSRWFGPTKRPTPRTVVTLRVLAMPLRPPVSLPTTLSLCARSFVEIDLRRAELDAERGEVRGFVHHGGDVQQRLRRNAADVQAHAAERRVALDQHGLHAEVGRAEGGRVAAGAGAEHQHLALDVGRAAERCGDRSRRAAPKPASVRPPAAQAPALAAARRRRAAPDASSTRSGDPCDTLSPSFTASPSRRRPPTTGSPSTPCRSRR